MYDSFNRKINYLRISVTDRCNLRCEYCMPKGGVRLIRRRDMLSFEELTEVARAAVSLGIDKLRISGGEPLVRKDIVSLVQMLAELGGVRDLAMTTNAVRLRSLARPLYEAGLHRLNISLDTLDPERFHFLTRGGQLHEVLDGIQAARDVGFDSIKLNCVVKESSDEADAQRVAAYGQNHGHEVRFIRRMDLASGKFWPIEGGSGGDCPSCNRLRLSSDGRIYPCLFSQASYSIKKLGIEEALKRAISEKPQSGHRAERTFNTLGG